MSEESANQAGPGRDVFVSYASQDAAVANSVVEHLEQQGIRCWIAPRDVKPGAAYADAIVRAINESSALVLVLSGAAMASEHVSREVERAASKHKQIVAFRVDGANLSAELEYFLSRSQWIDVPALGMPGALSKLAEAVGRGSVAAQAGPAAGGGGPAGRASIKQAVGTASVAKRVVVAAAIVIVLGVGGVLAVRFWQSNHGETAAPQMVAISEKSIAVLPFTDMSQKKDQEYFGDGMAEEILDLLAKIPGLTVIGRTSSFAFKGKNEDLRKIGTELNAAYVLEGSVRNSGDQVRITAQLINTKTGAHEWSETYDRPIGDVLKMQDAIAAAVVRELQLTVVTGNLQSRSTLRNAEAYDLILRGRHAADRTDREGLEEAVTVFQQALSLDPSSAAGEAELAQTYATQVIAGFSPPAVGSEQARTAATDALRLDPNNVLAHVVLARVHFRYDWDFVGAEQELKQAAALAPRDVEVLLGKGGLYLTLGRWEDALSQYDAALAQDPINPFALSSLGLTQSARSHFAEAESARRRQLDIRPAYAGGHFDLGMILLARGDRDGALLEMQRETNDEVKQLGLALVYYALGRTADSDSALAGMLKDSGGKALAIADVYAFRGRSDEAIRWLERAYNQKDFQLYLIKSDIALKNLQPDPRFKAFLKKLNLPE